MKIEATRQPRARKSDAPSQQANNVRRATCLAEEGQYGQAAKALLSHGLDFHSESAINNMKAKHPSPPPPPTPPPPNATPYSFSREDVLEALKSFHSLSAGGASGERPAHIKESISSDRGNSLLATLTRLINFFAAGKA